MEHTATSVIDFCLQGIINTLKELNNQVLVMWTTHSCEINAHRHAALTIILTENPRQFSWNIYRINCWWYNETHQCHISAYPEKQIHWTRFIYSLKSISKPDNKLVERYLLRVQWLQTSSCIPSFIRCTEHSHHFLRVLQCYNVRYIFTMRLDSILHFGKNRHLASPLFWPSQTFVQRWSKFCQGKNLI